MRSMQPWGESEHSTERDAGDSHPVHLASGQWWQAKSSRRRVGSALFQKDVTMAPSSTRALALLIVLAWGGEASAQEGFLVLRPMSEGSAQILIDGRPVGTLGARELSLTLPVGPHTFTARRSGFDAFTQSIRIQDGEPLVLTVAFQISDTRVVSGGETTGGVAKQSTGRLRIVHLDPLEVNVSVNGRTLGSTPLTLELPSGRRTVQVGRAELCVLVEPDAEGYVRFRGQVVEELRDVSDCRDSEIRVTMRNVPPGYRATSSSVAGQRREAGGVLSFSITEPGGHEVFMTHATWPDFMVSLSVGYGQDVEVVLGVAPPTLLGDTVPPEPPTVVDTVFSDRPPEDPRDPEGLRILRSMLSFVEASNALSQRFYLACPTDSRDYAAVRAACLPDLHARVDSATAAMSDSTLIAVYEGERAAWEVRRDGFQDGISEAQQEMLIAAEEYERRLEIVRANRASNETALSEWGELLKSPPYSVERRQRE